jgi:hypothetical protein
MAFGEMRRFGEKDDVQFGRDSVFFMASVDAISLAATP